MTGAVPGTGRTQEVPWLSAARIATLLGRPAPTPEQAAVIEGPLEPTLVVAGAGSGKTETMAGRVVWLLANGVVEPDQVLGLTFTRKAAGELGDRVRDRLRRLVRVATAEHVVLPGRAHLDGHGDVLGALARPEVSTYNAYAAGLVGDHALRLGVEPTARLIGGAAQWQLASEVVESWQDDLAVPQAPSTVVEAVLTLSGALDEHLLEPAEAVRGIEGIVAALAATPAGTPPRAPYADVLRLLGSLEARVRVLDLVAEYRRRRRERDLLDFGDQVALAARLARDVPEVGAGERGRFRVVLLDEYQDTSYAQLVLLRSLFGGGHAVTAVGDPHQSIYGWRGASAGGLERFPTDFPRVASDGDRRPAARRSLSTSWRNDHAVLDVANVVAGPLRAAVRAIDVPELGARPGAGAGEVAAVVAATVEDEAAAVAAFVRERWRPAGERTLGDRAAGGRAAGEDGVGRVTAAVLCRKRSQLPALRHAMLAVGLPVEVVGLGGLLDVPEVVDLVAALQAAHDPSRGDALMRLLTGARTRLGAADLHALAAWAGELAARPARADGAAAEADVVDERSIVDALDELPPPSWRSRTGRRLSATGRERLGELAGVLRAVRTHTYLTLPELVGEAERLLGLDIEVGARPAAAARRGRATLDAFREVAVEFSGSVDLPTLGGFLAWLDAAELREHGLEMPVVEPDPDAVQLVTVHAAKGLEWDAVAVAGLVDGVLPATAATGKEGPKDSAWLTGIGVLPYPLRGDRHDLPVLEVAGAADPKDLEDRRRRFVLDAGVHEVAEERRLAYVAVTRARRSLLLSAAWWGDGVRPRSLSPFLTELVEAGLVTTDGGAPAPGTEGAATTNPRGDVVETAVWPADPFGARGEVGSREPALRTAAEGVRAAMVEREATPAVGEATPTEGEPTRAAGEATPTAGVGGWAEQADRLLRERAAQRRPTSTVELPAHLSASAVVRLHADPARFARELRRPVPQEPSPQARRGTRFHAWVEGWYRAAALVDVTALPGADDDSLPVDVDEEGLRTRFLATPWAHRTPVAVEVGIETSVDGYVLRSRIDAVFGDEERPDVPGAVVVVDWKTGAPPADADARASRELQLAVYRLAWSRWTGTPLGSVRAAFCYVGTGATAYPERLLDEREITDLLRAAAPTDG